MTDTSRGGGDGDTPVNPYSLLEAVNNSSDTSHTGWLIFIAIMAYVMIAVAGVTHKDLLLETPVTLPILQVSIPQTQFFQFAPVLVVLFHLGLVAQLALLARKTLEFDAAVRSLEPTDRRTHPLRLELHNFFFVQAIAGPHRSAVMSAFLHAMSWLTLVVLPVILLLFVQIKFLPYHDVTITWMHRVALGCDIFILILIGVFLMRAEASFFQAFFRTTRQHPLSFIVTSAILIVVSFFSFFVATIPGERLDRMASGHAKADPFSFGFAIPFVHPRPDGTLFGLFHRNLVVTDTDLVVDSSAQSGEASLNLRGRDLRYAKLDRSDLHQADLTGANLDGASLIGADLRNIKMTCADLNAFILTDDRERGRCSTAVGANFARAKLSDARLAGVDFRNARFEEAQADGAEFAYADMTGANFAGAHVERADFTGGTRMQGANFLIAFLQGADLTGAQLQFADFSTAGMQGAVLSHASLEGAVLRDAELEGADLRAARLQGADLTGARLKAADLRETMIWMTDPPTDAALDLADLTDARVEPMDIPAIERLRNIIEGIDDRALASRLEDRLADVMGGTESAKWATSPARQRWQQMVQRRTVDPISYPAALTEHLTGLMCKPRWVQSSVAVGVAKRAQNPSFRGALPVVYARLRAEDCAGARNVPPRVLQQVSSAIDAAKDD
jgi:uncharacterized protein YjbI with pentapeptide repeats